MKTTRRTTAIEVLEARIAPAVLTGYNPTTGGLTVTGDGGDDAFSIFQTGTNTFRIAALNDVSPTTIDGGAFTDIAKLTSLSITLGNGTNTVRLINLLTLTQLDVTGGTGKDSVTTQAMATKGNATLALGGSLDTVSFGGLSTSIGGNLSATDSGGGLNVTLGSLVNTVKGAMAFTGSAAAADLLRSGLNSTVSIGKGLVFSGGGALGDSLDISGRGAVTLGKDATGTALRVVSTAAGTSAKVAGQLLTVAGVVVFSGAAGADGLILGQPNGITKFTGKSAGGSSAVFGSSVSFTGGNGSNSLAIQGATVEMAGSVFFEGGANGDVLTLGQAGGKTKSSSIETSVSFYGKGGTNSATIAGSMVTLAGPAYYSGSGSDTLVIGSDVGTTLITGKSASGESVIFGGNFGSGSGTSAMQILGSQITLAGGVVVDGGTGNDSIEVGGPASNVSIGRSADGASLELRGRAGDDLLSLEGNRVQLAGGAFLAGGTGADTLKFDGGSLLIGKDLLGQSVVLLDGEGNDSIDLRGALVSATGSILFLQGLSAIEAPDQNSSVSLFISAAKLLLGKDLDGISLAVVGGKGSDTATINAGMVVFAGTAAFSGGRGGTNSFALTDIHSLSSPGIEVYGASGDDSLHLSVDRVALGNLLFRGEEGDDDVLFEADGTITGEAIIDLGSGAISQSAQLVGRSGISSGLKLSKGLSIYSDMTSAGAETVTVTNVSVANDTLLDLSDGASTVAIDNLVGLGKLSIYTKGGADVVNFERRGLFGASSVAKEAIIDLGAGDDIVRIGDSTVAALAAHNRVRFLATTGVLVLKGGDGANDNRNADLKANFFPVGKEPIINGIELTTA